MAQKAYLDASDGMESYAERHGAQRDGSSQWYVTGNVPPELHNLAIDNKPSAKYRQSHLTPIRSTLNGVVNQLKGVPETPHERKKLSQTDLDQIEKILDLAKEKIDGNDKEVWIWLNTPKRVALKGKTPFEVITSASGRQVIVRLLHELYGEVACPDPSRM
jgi:hypothetical protein